MQKATESMSDWGRVQRQYDSNTSIAYDDDDRAEGLYDPNDSEAVRTAWSSGRIYKGYPPVEITPVQELTLQLPQDVVTFYQAKGKSWQDAIAEALRRAMITE